LFAATGGCGTSEWGTGADEAALAGCEVEWVDASAGAAGSRAALPSAGVGRRRAGGVSGTGGAEFERAGGVNRGSAGAGARRGVSGAGEFPRYLDQPSQTAATRPRRRTIAVAPEASPLRRWLGAYPSVVRTESRCAVLVVLDRSDEPRPRRSESNSWLTGLRVGRRRTPEVAARAIDRASPCPIRCRARRRPGAKSRECST